jgi:hypothetical protein
VERARFPELRWLYLEDSQTRVRWNRSSLSKTFGTA